MCDSDWKELIAGFFSVELGLVCAMAKAFHDYVRETGREELSLATP